LWAFHYLLGKGFFFCISTCVCFTRQIGDCA
jgi:hypothetical protein